MRSVKGVILGFLLILLGFVLSGYQLIAGFAVSACALVLVILSALPRRTKPPQSMEAPMEKAAAPKPEELPDILTDMPKRASAPQPPPPPSDKEASTALYPTLADAFTRIDALSCRGAAWSLERDLRLCQAFIDRWNGARTSAPFMQLLRAKGRYADYSDEFLLPGFGRRGKIAGRRTSGDFAEDLSGAVLKRVNAQQAALEQALQTQRWFESLLRKVRRIPAQQSTSPRAVSADALPEPLPLLRKTDPAQLELFYALARRSAVDSKHAAELAIVKFRRFSPAELMLVPDHSRELDDALGWLGSSAPIVVFRQQELAGLGLAPERAVYALQPLFEQRGSKIASLADACGEIFAAPPTLLNTQADAMACGLIFCQLCDRTLHLRTQ